ncbi:hypothetical protein H6504_00285 [Candidatus Woesearchaeota archaeon]|nr:hypothetical protein [Candidatus Woesearchaeota archaeon]
MRNVFIITILILLVLPLASAQKTMPILAIKATDDFNETGSIARIFLDKQPGSGRVFIDTIPISKADTQMSTRLANRIACDITKNSCEHKDFFYTIRAGSSIIGGPSASAAAAIITVADIDNLEINEGVSITGTINSGNIIGPVGGLPEKIRAAKAANLTTVLIPKGESIVPQENETINLTILGDELGINVIEVGTLEEALLYVTGKDYRKEEKQVRISADYTSTMRDLSELLCDRTAALTRDVSKDSLENWTDRELTINFTRWGKEAYQDKLYYSAASYCFGANVRLNTHLMENNGLSSADMQLYVDELKKETARALLDIKSKDIQTITDLQTYMIVNERYQEAIESLQEIKFENGTVPYYLIAYSEERLRSGDAWAEFFGSPGTEFSIDEQALHDSCLTKIDEADEIYQYINLLFPSQFTDLREEYSRAYSSYERGDYAICLFKASKVKARSNVMMTSFGVRSENINTILDLKLDVAEQHIAEQTASGKFPIVGYSYLEYARSLQQNDPYSAMLYAEYALELSNLDLYFKQPSGFTFYYDYRDSMMFIAGILFGFAFASTIYLARELRKKKKSKRRKKY